MNLSHETLSIHNNLTTADTLNSSSLNASSAANVVLGKDVILVPFIISTFGIIGNFMTFVTIVRTEMRKNYANTYILVLLCSDTLLLLNLNVRFWVQVDTISFGLCALWRYLWSTTVYISNLVIVSLTLERFFAIVFPLHHMRHSHLNRWKVILAWLLPTLVLSLNVLYALRPTNGDTVSIHFSSSSSDQLKCIFDYEKPFVDLIFHIPRLIFSFILTLVVVTSVNLVIGLKLRSRTVFRGDSSSRDAQATTIILAVIPIVYVVLNSPFWVRTFLKFFKTNSANYQFINQHYFFTTISYYMFCMNFSTNFLVYALISPTFRASFLKVWLCKNDPGSRVASSVRFNTATTVVMRISSDGKETTLTQQPGVVEEAHVEKVMPKRE